MPSEDIFQLLPRMPKEHFYPELYQNDILSVEEKAALMKRHDREFITLRQAFLKALNSGNKSVRFFRDCDNAFLEDVKVSDTYSQCYNQICIQERFGITRSLEKSNIPTFSSPALTQFILDGPPGQILQTYCMPTRDLLISMAKDGINPLTGVRYSQSALNQVRNNFSTELKLVEYALRISPKLQKAPYSLTQTSQMFMYQSSSSQSRRTASTD